MATFLIVVGACLHVDACLIGDEPCRIQVVEKGSGWPVPLVELRTTHHVRLVTDNAGVAAVDAPDLLGRELWLDVSSDGYEVPKDGFGFRGVRRRLEPGRTVRVEIERTSVAQRLGRLTGGGLYAEARKVGLHEPMTESGVLGCDSVQNAVHGGRLFWVWGDTSMPEYPLGIFGATGATTLVNPLKSAAPPLALTFDYFRDGNGRPRAVSDISGEGPTWLTGLVSLPDARGVARLGAVYLKIRPGTMETHECGLAAWDEGGRIFRRLVRLWSASESRERPRLPEGHASDWRDEEGRDWVLLGNPFPAMKIPARWEAWQDASTWVTLATPSELASPEGVPVKVHSGSMAWSKARNRWVTIFVEQFGKPTFLGEVWYAEASRPGGPWGRAVKVLGHRRHTFYNPRLHIEFSADDARAVYFEGTFTADFAGHAEPLPRYNYNQVLYRLDLDDSRLAPAR